MVRIEKEKKKSAYLTEVIILDVIHITPLTEDESTEN